ncbi:hypothetical protein OOK36_55335 [Streptomyces sp. NBC_00365]|nr:hypothetical protein [Streptomyces sp. NBC_00365]MCX5097629.1 hypothetical protein [Streptomyces sp. NBC_00365]
MSSPVLPERAARAALGAHFRLGGELGRPRDRRRGGQPLPAQH